MLRVHTDVFMKVYWYSINSVTTMVVTPDHPGANATLNEETMERTRILLPVFLWVPFALASLLIRFSLQLYLFTPWSQFSFALSFSRRAPLYPTCSISGESRFPLPDVVSQVPFSVLDPLVIDLISLIRFRQLTLCRPSQRLYAQLLCLVQGRRFIIR